MYNANNVNVNTQIVINANKDRKDNYNHNK